MSGEQYDPNDHTVDEVNDYLASADDTERERVLGAERDGKNRTTVNGNSADDVADEEESGGVYDESVEREDTTSAFIIPNFNTVPQSVQEDDAKARNEELQEAGVIHDQGFIGSDGAANLLG